MMFSPATYDAEERMAMERLPNRLIAACQPVTFGHIGYPTRISDPKSVWRYADVMHEGRFQTDFDRLLAGRLSRPEWSMWQEIVRTVYGLTERRQPIVPHGALTRAFYSFRRITEMITPPATVVEIGPGSGYLTALLALAGYTTVAVEVTQAFYLWQSCLYEMLFDERYKPFAATPWIMGSRYRIYHPPWWEFYKVDAQDIHAQTVSLVTANHCVAEMTQDCLAYLAHCCKTWKCPLVIDSVGLQHPKNELDLRGMFTDVDVREDEDAVPPPIDDGVRYLDDVIRFQQELLGRRDARTPDELWLDSLYGDNYYS